MNLRDSSSCGKGTVFLRKVIMSDFHKEPFVEKREKEIAENKKPEKISPPIKKSEPVVSSKDAHPRDLSKKDLDTKRPGSKKDSISNNRTAGIKKKSTAPAIKKAVAHNPSKNDIAAESVKPILADSIKTDRKITAPAITPKVLLNRQNQLVKTITVNTN